MPGGEVQDKKLYAQYQAYKRAAVVRSAKRQKHATLAMNTTNIHRTEIMLFEAAKQYLPVVMHKHFDPAKLPTITKWKAKRQQAAAEQQIC